MRNSLLGNIVKTSVGEWVHAPGANFMFTYIPNAMKDDQKTLLQKKFNTGLHIHNLVKENVKKITGKQVIEDLYISDVPTMTQALKQIEGMQELISFEGELKGNAVASQVGLELFSRVLKFINSDVTPLGNYIDKALNSLQLQVSLT